MSIFVEPQEVFLKRHEHAEEDAFAFVAGDKFVFSFLRDGPQRFGKLLKHVCSMLPARSSRQRRAIRREMVLRIGKLIQRGQLQKSLGNYLILPQQGGPAGYLNHVFRSSNR